MEYPLAVGDFLDRAVTVYAERVAVRNPIACGVAGDSDVPGRSPARSQRITEILCKPG
jgi:hypothetical protein